MAKKTAKTESQTPERLDNVAQKARQVTPVRSVTAEWQTKHPDSDVSAAGDDIAIATYLEPEGIG